MHFFSHKLHINLITYLYIYIHKVYLMLFGVFCFLANYDLQEEDEEEEEEAKKI